MKAETLLSVIAKINLSDAAKRKEKLENVMAYLAVISLTEFHQFCQNESLDYFYLPSLDVPKEKEAKFQPSDYISWRGALLSLFADDESLSGTISSKKSKEMLKILSDPTYKPTVSDPLSAELASEEPNPDEDVNELAANLDAELELEGELATLSPIEPHSALVQSAGAKSPLHSSKPSSPLSEDEVTEDSLAKARAWADCQF